MNMKNKDDFNQGLALGCIIAPTMPHDVVSFNVKSSRDFNA